ncbi:tyrosine-type recombinase/integrase [bacterium]|nr:tyrosine-type recombinase/integrase [bacterium]
MRKRDREIPMNDEPFELLLKMRSESKCRHVIEKNNSKRYDRALWENFQRLVKKLGIEKAGIHTFRHIFTSGHNLVTIRKICDVSRFL